MHVAETKKMNVETAGRDRYSSAAKAAEASLCCAVQYDPYRGPFRQVVDDDGHVLRRGVRTAVCEKAFNIFSREPYRDQAALIQPNAVVPLDIAPPFSRSGGAQRRDPRETKGEESLGTTDTTSSEGGKNGGCC